MRNKIIPFLFGLIVMALVFSFGTAALAASGQISYNKVNISLLGNTIIAAGDTVKDQDGREAPSVITYTDETGGQTNYLPVRKISEMFDADINWDADTNTIFLAESNGDVTIGVGNGSDSEELKSPVLGLTAGPFTEIDPKNVDMSRAPYVLLDSAQFNSETGFINQRYYCDPQRGNYVVMTISNNDTGSEHPLKVCVSRPKTISLGGCEPFSNVSLSPGESIVRAFKVEDNSAELTRFLELDIDSTYGDITNVTVSVKQYNNMK